LAGILRKSGRTGACEQGGEGDGGYRSSELHWPRVVSPKLRAPRALTWS
jgi:hypothetical protein